jgi:hypothetical protein
MKPYVPFTIGLTSNKKSEDFVDPVRGCLGARERKGGCYNECYACRMAARGGVQFDTPVVGKLNTKLLKKQLAESNAKWIRIGTAGDPSQAWSYTDIVARLVRTAGKVPVIMTKCWKIPTDKQLDSLAKSLAVMQISVSSFDTVHELKKRLGTAERYASRWKNGVILKVITAPFRTEPSIQSSTGLTSARVMSEFQKSIISVAREKYRLMELPLRLFRTNPNLKTINELSLRPHISPISKKPDGKLTGGVLFADPARGDLICAETLCKDCENQCGTSDLKGLAAVGRTGEPQARWKSLMV